MAEQNIVQGLFGMTPESYQQQRDAAALKQAASFGQMDPMQAARTSIYYGANQLGNLVGGMLGAEDPQLVRIRQQQQVLSGLDVNDLDSIAQATMRANQMGNPQLALQLSALGDKVLERQDLSLQRQDLSLERQDKLRQRAAAAQSLARTQTARDLISRGLSVTPETISGQSAATVPEVDEQGYPLRSTLPGYQPPELKLDYARLAPILMQSPEGRTELAAIVASQKAMRPETVSIKEGETIYSVPTTPGGAYKAIVSGGDKPTPFTGEMANAALTLYKTNDPTKIYKEFGQPGLDAVDKKAQQMALAKRPVTTVNLPNEGERKAATLANRLNFSVDQINQAIGIDPNAAMPNTSVEIARFLSRSEFIPNKLTSAQRQIVESAQLDILDAALTLGTGAAYTQAQLEGYRKSYFPQIGDKPENVVAKRARLQNILRSAEIASGRAKVPTQIPSSGADLSSIITAPASN